jgi:hypothetical protein
MNNEVAQLFIRIDRNGSIGTRRLKIAYPHAWFEDLDL